MDLGVNVINAVTTLHRLSAEVEAMLAEIERLLSDPVVSRVVTPEGEDRMSSVDDTISDGWLRTFEVREKRAVRGRGRRLGQLSFVVDIGRSEGPAIAIGHPCIIVAWSTPAPGDSWTDALMEGDFWPITPDSYDIVHERLLVWHEREAGELTGPVTDLAKAAWFYMVPLFAVTGAEDVRNLLLQPVSRLLDGDVPSLAFADTSRFIRLEWLADDTPGIVTTT